MGRIGENMANTNNKRKKIAEDYQRRWHLQSGVRAQQAVKSNRIAQKMPVIQTTKRKATNAANSAASKAEITANQVANSTSVYATRPPKSRKKMQGNSHNSKGVKRRGRA